MRFSGLRIQCQLRAMLVALALLHFAGEANSQTCTVLDTELQEQYSGSCVNGLADGYGTAKGIADFQGMFRAGMKHGAGKKTWPWGDLYEGEYLNDEMTGYGRYSWSSSGPRMGERYEGQFVSNLREGGGTYKWPSGEELSGRWLRDLPSAQADRPDLFQRLIARARSDLEAQLAVGKVGMRVCRMIPIGISEKQLVIGTVVAVRQLAVSVRIADHGPSRLYLNGSYITKGAVIWDVAPSWIPCR
jgi:hypothetical protein